MLFYNWLRECDLIIATATWLCGFGCSSSFKWSSSSIFFLSSFFFFTFYSLFILRFYNIVIILPLYLFYRFLSASCIVTRCRDHFTMKLEKKMKRKTMMMVAMIRRIRDSSLSFLFNRHHFSATWFFQQ